MAPTNTAEPLSHIQARYRAFLQRTSEGEIKRSIWYGEWYVAYGAAKRRNIPEVEGGMAVRDFLRAVGNKMAPNWARNAYWELVRREVMDEPIMPLEDYARWLKALIDEDEIIAIMGNRGSICN